MTVPSLFVATTLNPVSPDNFNTYAQTCGIPGDLRAFIGVPGVQVYMRGYQTPGDGGQGFFYWNAAGTDVDDNGVTTVVPTGSGSGIWTRISNADLPVTNVALTELKALAVTAANSSLVLPANTYIDQIIINNTTANAITGGLKIGSTLGGTDIVAAQAVGASVLLRVAQASILKGVFSLTATQTLYIDAVSAWNSASITIIVIYGQLT